jgi:hypothetical protein
MTQSACALRHALRHCALLARESNYPKVPSEVRDLWPKQRNPAPEMRHQQQDQHQS